MNKFFTLGLVLIACVTAGHCSGYDGGIQQIALNAVPDYSNIETYLNGAPSSSSSSASSSAGGHGSQYGGAPIQSYAPIAPAYAPAQQYAPQPSYAPATSIVLPSAPSYSAPALSRGPSAAYAPSAGYAQINKYNVQPAYSTQLYPGQTNYKAFASPPQSSKVALPILPHDPVAKLYIPNNNYGRLNTYGDQASY